MNNEYPAADLAAQNATAKAARESTIENHKQAAALQLAAAIHAKAVGKGVEMQAHNMAGKEHIAVLRVLEAASSEAKCGHLNEDGTFKGGFDGCVLHMKSSCGGDHSEESAKKICGAIAQNASSGKGKMGLKGANAENANEPKNTKRTCPQCKLPVHDDCCVAGKCTCKACGKQFEDEKETETNAGGGGGKVKAMNAEKSAALKATARKRMLADKSLQASVMDDGYSFNDLQEKLRAAVGDIESLKTSTGSNQFAGGPWVMDIVCPEHEEGETWEAIVSGPDNKLFKVSFTLDDDGVTIVGEPEQVKRTTDYETVAKNGYSKSGLQAGRAEKTAANKYQAAALQAAEASDGIKKGHMMACSLHKIANEHALMAGEGYQANALMHTAKANEHAAEAEACNGKLPARMAVTAGGAGKDRLEAEGSSEGAMKGWETRKGMGTSESQSKLAQRHSFGAKTDGLHSDASREADQSSEAANRSSELAKTKQDHEYASRAHVSAAEAHEHAATTTDDTAKQNRSMEKATDHRASAAYHASKAGRYDR